MSGMNVLEIPVQVRTSLFGTRSLLDNDTQDLSHAAFVERVESFSWPGVESPRLTAIQE